jgi:hypothetical protein
MSLINDPHPSVHFWALNALARVINAASLAYAPFVSGTLGMLLKVYLTESHEREGGFLTNANTSGDFPAYPVVCQMIDSVITVLGPDIQDSPRTRSLVLNLFTSFLLKMTKEFALKLSTVSSTSSCLLRNMPTSQISSNGSETIYHHLVDH